MSLIKSQFEQDILREGGKILASIMQVIKDELQFKGLFYNPAKLEQLAKKLMAERNVQSCFQGYILNNRPYPTVLCVSVNNEVAHVPATSQRYFRLGDIIKVDCGIRFQGYCTDMAFTLILGTPKISADARLVQATKLALDNAIEKCVVGTRLKDLSYTIHKTLSEYNVDVPSCCGGHFIGQMLHEEPIIYNNFNVKYFIDIRLEAGMVFCLEPIATLGAPDLRLLRDGFSLTTKDGSKSAHFEHMILVTNTGPEVLTTLVDHDKLPKRFYVQ